MLTANNRPTDYFGEAAWKRDLLRRAGLEYEPDPYDLLARIIELENRLSRCSDPARKEAARK